ncbi:7-deoxyloganetin glucosyltransferase [Linum grandiflorum]
MGSHGGANSSTKRHVVCIPYPAQGHLNPMMKLAKLLHSLGGFHISYVNTNYNHRRLLKSRGSSLDGLPDFRFHSIPDGLPDSEFEDATQDIPALCESTKNTCTAPFRDLLLELNADDEVPPVSFVISDACMSFTLDATEELGIPEVVFWTPSACGVLAYANYRRLAREGLFPLKDEKDLTNGYLNTPVDWIPAMQGIQLKDFPNFIRTTDENATMFNFLATEIDRTSRASAVIFNTFHRLEQPVLDSLSAIFPPIYPIGPLTLMLDQIITPNPNNNLNSINSSLWKEEPECLQWLNTKEPNSVVYVNFGSITVVTRQHMVEFAWGLANSKKTFLWIVRPDLVRGESALLPEEFAAETRDRGMLASWCPQEEVLKHPAIGGFLSHMGWNSTLDSVCNGVPMVCWPFFAEQQTNCWSACGEWGIGMEIDSDVKRGEVEELVRELMEGRRGKEMKLKAEEWKKLAIAATQPGGSSRRSFDGLVELLRGGGGSKLADKE